MDLRQLQALVAIADNGSFSSAAAALHTVQSNVSSHVGHLERELGANLVDRQAGQLTEEGQAVVERARRVAAELDAMVADIAALRDEIAGTVRIGMIGTTARWLAPLLLDRLAADHPGVHLVVGEGTTATLEPQLLSGALDAAVVNAPHTSAELIRQPLFDEDLVLVVSMTHPMARKQRVNLAELDGMELLLPAHGTAFREELEQVTRAASVTLVAKAELDGLRLMAALTVRGYGPAILPATGAVGAPEGFCQVAVDGLPLRRVGVVQRRRGRPSAPARATLEILHQVVAANLAEQYGLHAPRSEAVPEPA